MRMPVSRMAVSARVALSCSVAALGLAAMPAMAQETEEAQPAGDMPAENYDGNEIVVTATKREQTLQDVPVAVSVTTSETIERAFIRDIKDLATVVPSLRVGERQNSSNTNFFIRGFGNGANNAGIEPSVGVFIDNVYRSRSAAQIADLPDVERIEVLRGPQSTLFGKNASAGVISVITQKPKFTFGGNVEASYGNYDAWVLKGVVTGPVTDTLALSLSGSVNKRDGFFRDLGTGGRTNDRNRWFIRGQALFEPNSDLSVRIIGDYGKIDEICCAVVNVRAAAPTFILTNIIGGRVNLPQDAFDNIVYNNFDSTNKIESYGVSGQIDYRVGPMTLTSITAYRRSTTNANFDSDFTSADLLRGSNLGFIDLKTFTQELRLSANFLDKLNVLVGGFYFNEKVEQSTQLRWGRDARAYANQLLLAQAGVPITTLEAQLGALTSNNYAGLFFAQGQGLDELYHMKNENFSIFSQVDFEVTDRLTLTGGISYTNDKKRYTTNVFSSDTFANINLTALGNALIGAGQVASGQRLLALRPFQFFPPFVNVPNATENGRTSDDKFTYTARVAYDATDTINVYASYATGYKASSINLSRDSRPGQRSAAPENSEVFEFGLKGNWSVASANLAVFHQAIKGFQSNIFTGTGFVLANAGKQSVFGIEFEGNVRPTKWLTLGLSMTYLDPKYDDFKNSAFGDATGITPADIPPISATFWGEINKELGNGDRVILRGSYHYESETQVVEGLPGFIQRNPVTGAVLPGGYQPGLDAARPFTREVDELDASLTYALSNGLELSVWGRNLLDDRFISTIFDSPAQNGSVSAYPNGPRTYGVAARFRW